MRPNKLQNRYALLPVEEILEQDKLNFQEPQETLDKMEPRLTKNLPEPSDTREFHEDRDPPLSSLPRQTWFEVFGQVDRISGSNLGTERYLKNELGQDLEPGIEKFQTSQCDPH